MDLIFASHNQHKLEEVRAALGHGYTVTSLAELAWTQEIPETEDSLLGNALLKARTVYRELKRDCFADDTGLEIEALDGKPGVHTSRFAGENATGEENRAKTLALLDGYDNRRAVFRTVIALILEGRVYTFEGHVPGQITKSARGESGLAYSPIFRPVGYDKTYAEMSLEQRNQLSHRAMAIARMKDFLSLRTQAVAEKAP